MAAPAPLPGTANRWPPLIIVICVLLAFGRLFGASFTWFDDQGTIAQNPHLGPAGNVGEFWAHAQADLYAPLTYTLWAALARATWVTTPDDGGVHVDPHVFHAANVALHVAAALLVYALLLDLFRKPWPALAGTLLFALHPLQVEPVAWASGTKDVLAGTLSIAALLLYVRHARGGGRGWLIGATIAFAGALLSKPSAVTVPLLAATLDLILLKRPWRRVVPALFGWIVLSIPVILINRSVQTAAHATDTPPWFRFFVAGDALTFYLYKLALPLNMGLQYRLRPLDLFHQPIAYAGWLVPAAIGARVVRTRHRWLQAACLVVFAAPLTTLGFVAFDWQWYSAVADHYLYVAMLGPALVLTATLATVARRPAWIGAFVGLATLGTLSFRQAGVWHDNASLARHALAVNPRAFVAYSLLGSGERRDDPEAAIRYYLTAVAIEPRYTPVHEVLRSMLEARGRTDDLINLAARFVAANDAMRPAAQVDASGSCGFLARTLEDRGDYARALTYYERLARTHPQSRSAADDVARVRLKVKTK